MNFKIIFKLSGKKLLAQEINVGKALLKSNLALYEEDVYVTKTDAALKQLYLSSSEHVSNNEVDIAETPEQSTEETDNSSTELSKVGIIMLVYQLRRMYDSLVSNFAESTTYLNAQ